MIKKNLFEFLSPKAGVKVTPVDRYTEFKVRYEAAAKENVLIYDVEAVINSIPSGESWHLEIGIGNGEPFILDATVNIKDFVDTINENFLDIDDEAIYVSLDIYKALRENKIHIYDFAAFTEFVGDISFEDLLEILADDLSAEGFLTFEVHDVADINFFSDKLVFVSSGRAIPALGHATLWQKTEYCNFNKKNEYRFTPQFFSLIQRPEIENKISQKLDVLAVLFSIVGIFDVTTLSQDDLFFKLNGFRLFEGTKNLNEIPLGSKDTYIKIYDWIYSDSGSTGDKIGLTRNILSIYLKDNSLELENNAYYSLQSGFNVYLQNNLNRYVEIRSKLNDELSNISDKANKAIDEYLSGFKTSLLTFLSFFVSVFIVRVLANGKVEGVFNKEATIISLGFIVLMLAYLLFSLVVLNWEKDRLEQRYRNLKGRFEDLLIKDDIQKILRDDSEYNDEIAHIKNKRRAYTFMWAFMVCLLTVCILGVSSYLNWYTIIEGVRGIF